MSQSPTATKLFGPSPWVTSPVPGGIGPSKVPYTYNPAYFATEATAKLVATIVELGCKFPKGSVKVVAENAITPSGPFRQNQPNQMIVLPDGSHHYAGLIALEFQTWPSMETINQDLTDEFGCTFTFVMPPKPTK